MLLSYEGLTLILTVLPGSRKLLLSDSPTHFQFKVPFRSTCFGEEKRNLKHHKKTLKVSRMKKILKVQEMSHIGCFADTELLSHGPEHPRDTLSTKATVTKCTYCCTTVMVTGESWRETLVPLDPADRCVPEAGVRRPPEIKEIMQSNRMRN